MNAGDLLEIRIPRTVFGIGALARLADVAKGAIGDNTARIRAQACRYWNLLGTNEKGSDHEARIENGRRGARFGDAWREPRLGRRLAADPGAQPQRCSRR